MYVTETILSFCDKHTHTNIRCSFIRTSVKIYSNFKSHDETWKCIIDNTWNTSNSGTYSFHIKFILALYSLGRRCFTTREQTSSEITKTRWHCWFCITGLLCLHIGTSTFTETWITLCIGQILPATLQSRCSLGFYVS